jgi:hypothetical protein
MKRMAAFHFPFFFIFCFVLMADGIEELGVRLAFGTSIRKGEDENGRRCMGSDA